MKMGLLMFGLGCAFVGARAVEVIVFGHLGSILGFFVIDIPLIFFGIRRLKKATGEAK